MKTVAKIAIAAGLFGVGAYVYDVLILPARKAKKAREEADDTDKPMLNVGAGTPGSSLRAALFGNTTWGDVNMDIAADRGVRCGPNSVCYGDVHKIPYPDKHFGTAIASHVIEHVENPIGAIRELHRVADKVHVVVPKLWAPHTYLHPGHRWIVTRDGRAMKLWILGSQY